MLDFVAGGAAGCVSTTLTYPFDILRTRLAAQTEPKVRGGWRRPHACHCRMLAPPARAACAEVPRSSPASSIAAWCMAHVTCLPLAVCEVSTKVRPVPCSLAHGLQRMRPSCHSPLTASRVVKARPLLFQVLPPPVLGCHPYCIPNPRRAPSPAGFEPALAIVVPGAGLSFMFYKGALRLLTWAADGLPGSAPTAKYPLERLAAGCVAETGMGSAGRLALVSAACDGS